MSLSTTLKIGFDATSVQRGLAGLSSKVSKFSTNIAKVGVTTLAAGLTAAGIATVAFAKSASDAASNTEALTSQFETLLGSTGAAQKRMEEITDFAAKTPFEIKELASTSKMLEVVAGEMLSTGKGLRMVGDAAALAGEPIQEVGLHIGRVFQAMTSGTSAGESVSRLQELGLISGQTKIKFQELAEQQKKGKADVLSQSQAYDMLSGAMSKSQGSMEKLSQTTQGKLSNLRDNIDQLKVSFGTGFNEGLKDALDAANGFLPKLMETMTTAGKFIGKAISEAVSGDTSKFELIGRIIGEAIKLGIKNSFEGIATGMVQGATNLAISAGGAIGMDKVVDKIGGEGTFKKGQAGMKNLQGMANESNKDFNFQSSGLKIALDQLKIQTDKIKAADKKEEDLSKQREIGKVIAKSMSMEGINGKNQVSIGKAIQILMNIEKKLNPQAPAKM